jgi:mannose-1-phosphate guanylyltransferase/mannose-6-phosphate isomerase
MSQAVIPVILSGGSGTRLWPLSRELRPKQLLPLVTSNSLLQDTVLRTRALTGLVDAPLVICNEAHRFLVAEQLREIKTEAQAIVLEPEGRNTAPAVAVAALLAQEAHAAGIDPLLLVLPADHLIRDEQAFAQAVSDAVSAASEGRLVTFGIVPDRPETGYGYIRRGAAESQWSTVEEFVEKPDADTARMYVDSGAYLWNSGMFLFSAEAYLSELRRHAPVILECCEQATAGSSRDQDFTRLGAEFLDCPADSIDYAVMEKTDRAVVVPLAAGWSDVGSWTALHELLDKDEHGNVLRGDVLAEGCRDSYIASNCRLVVAIGLDGHVVVETEDAVLVMARGSAQDVKALVDALKAEGRAEVRGSGDPAD